MPPRLTAKPHTRRAPRNARTSRPSASSIENTAPGPSAWRAWISASASLWEPGTWTFATAGCASIAAMTFRALSCCRSIRTARVFTSCSSR